MRSVKDRSYARSIELTLVAAFVVPNTLASETNAPFCRANGIANFVSACRISILDLVVRTPKRIKYGMASIYTNLGEHFRKLYAHFFGCITTHDSL